MTRSRRRRGARKQARYVAFYETLVGAGTATLCEISYSGARLEVDADPPEAGEMIRVYVWPPHQAEPYRLAGRVVAARKGGFAIEYTGPGQEICQWIDTLESEEASSGATSGRSVEQG